MKLPSILYFLTWYQSHSSKKKRIFWEKEEQKLHSSILPFFSFFSKRRTKSCDFLLIFPPHSSSSLFTIFHCHGDWKSSGWQGDRRRHQQWRQKIWPIILELCSDEGLNPYTFLWSYTPGALLIHINLKADSYDQWSYSFLGSLRAKRKGIALLMTQWHRTVNLKSMPIEQQWTLS